MDKMAIEAVARQQAIQYLLRHLLVAHVLRDPDPVGTLAAMRGNVRETLSAETYGEDPALSDHISAEIEAAVDEQLSAVLQHPALVRLQSGRNV